MAATEFRSRGDRDGVNHGREGPVGTEGGVDFPRMWKRD